MMLKLVVTYIHNHVQLGVDSLVCIQDISLDECRNFLYGWGGEFDIQAKTIGYHPTTPIVSNRPICLPDPRSCPGTFNST